MIEDTTKNKDYHMNRRWLFGNTFIYVFERWLSYSVHLTNIMVAFSRVCANRIWN